VTSNLPIGASGSFPFHSQSHPARVSTRVRGQAHMHLVCGQLYERRPSWRSRHLPPLSCCFSAAAVGFSDHPVPVRTCAFLTDRPTSGWSIPLDRNRVAMFHTGQIRPVSGASYTPGPWCSHDRQRNSDHHCSLPAADPDPRPHISSAAVLANEAYRGSLVFTLPAFPFACNPRQIGALGRLPRASHPAVAGDPCRGGDRFRTLTWDNT
jgi:hypothetical protein